MQTVLACTGAVKTSMQVFSRRNVQIGIDSPYTKAYCSCVSTKDTHHDQNANLNYVRATAAR